MTQRLNLQVLDTLPHDVCVPIYDRADIQYGIVHLGVGAFHRCHQAIYTEAVLNRFQGDWGILGVSLRSPAVRDAMLAQDFLYSVTMNDGVDTECQVVGAIQNVLVAPESPQKVVLAIADPKCKIVTLTITEKGYCIDHASGELDVNHPDISHDIADLAQPKSAIGYIVAALQVRYQQCRPGISLLSCDNLRHNSAILRSAVLTFAQRIDASLAQWIDNQCTFPCSMVDRIVPATTDKTLAQAQHILNVADNAALRTEKFSQWVIEDKFVGERPKWDAVGAQLIDDVSPFEEMKLRMLNGSHSTLAYLGCLAGYETVAEAINNPALVALITQLMEKEMAPTLTRLDNFDLHDYQRQLIARFQNADLQHRTHQIAIDGSQKIPQRLLPALQWQVNHHQRIDVLCLAIAAWVRFTLGRDDNGNEYIVDDPMADTFKAIARETNYDDEQYLTHMLALENVFPASLLQQNKVRSRITDWFKKLTHQGVKRVLETTWRDAV